MTSRYAAALLLAGALSAPAAAAPAPLQSVQARYNLSLNGTPIAVMHETFEVRDGSYRAVSETRAVGLFKLVQRRPGRVTSRGKAGPGGLRPLSFDGTRGTRDPRSVHADFDWSARTLRLVHDDRIDTAALPPGTQDRLSAMYQFLYLEPEKLDNLAFPMTNGRKLDHYRYAVGPDKAIDTPLGRLAVVHLVKQRAAGDTETEIWLARAHRLMPVKMRVVEDDGERYEQVISALDIR